MIPVLAVDLRNRFASIAILDGENVIAGFELGVRDRTSDEIGLTIVDLVRAHGHDPGHIGGSIISSVNPPALPAFTRAVEWATDTLPMLVGRGMKTGLQLRTDNPRELGADRIARAVGAWEGSGPVVVVGCSEVLTLDVLNARGHYIGGAILPGLGTAADALVRVGARLPAIDPTVPQRAIGKDTAGAMASGVFFGTLGAAEGLIARFTAELGTSPTVVATGTDAQGLAAESTVFDRVDPDLAMRGLARLYARND